VTARFVPLTAELVERYYGKPQPWTMRGQALMRDDEVLGVFGIYRDKGFEIAFAAAKPEVWQKPPPVWFRRVIISAVRTIIRMKNPNRPLYAYATETEPNSERLLEHFGFEHVKGRFYQWP